MTNTQKLTTKQRIEVMMTAKEQKKYNLLVEEYAKLKNAGDRRGACLVAQKINNMGAVVPELGGTSGTVAGQESYTFQSVSLAVNPAHEID